MNESTNGNLVPSDDSQQGITLYTPVEVIKPHNDVSLTAPQSVVDRMWFYAEQFADSTLYKKNGLQKPSDYFIAFGKGYELGIPLFQTFDYIFQVGGKLCTDGKGMIALLRMRPEVDDIEIEELEDRATVTVIMTNGRRYTQTFTQSEAVAAGLTGKDGWKYYPSAMRVWRAVAKLVRFHLPHLVGGLLYTKEELETVDTIKSPQKPHVREFNEYLTQVAPDYPDTHWFIVNPKPFVGFLRRDVPQWKDLSPLDIVKTALQTVGKTSWVDFASGRDAVNAIKSKLGIVPDPAEPPSNVIQMPQSENPPAPTFSNGETPPPPVEIDPLSVQPTPPPKEAQPSEEFDLNTPEGVQNSIKLYGESHWFIKNQKDFLALLRRVIPNQDSLDNNELNNKAMTIAKVKNWKGFKTGNLAVAFLCQELGVPVPKVDTTPAPPPVVTPPPAVAPVPSAPPPPQTYDTSLWLDEFDEFIYANFDMRNTAEWEAKAGKKLNSYPSLEAIQADARAIAMRDEWDILVDEARYVNGGRNAYIEFNGILKVRMYGRSSTFKKQVGDAYYAENKVEGWENGGVYKIGLLRVSWKKNEAGTLIAHAVKVVEEADADITPEETGLTEDELDAMAKVEI